MDHTLKKTAAPPPTSSTCRDLRKVDVSRQRKSTSSTMLNIRIEGEIDTEISLQSDVHEMKEELATLRQILAVEADQTRKLKEEVRYLTPAFQYRTSASSYDSTIWYTSSFKLVKLPELGIQAAHHMIQQSKVFIMKDQCSC